MHKLKRQFLPILTTVLLAAGCSLTDPPDVADDNATDGQGIDDTGEAPGAAGVTACSGPDQSELECGGERPAVLRTGDPAAPDNVLRFRNSVEHGDHRANPLHFQPGPNGFPAGALGPGDEINASCDASDLQGLSGDALTDYLVAQTMNCLYYLWTPDAGVQAALTDANVEFVANKISALAPGYDGTNSLGHRQLLFFVRIAYYHAFYGSVPAPDPSTDVAVQAGLQAMAGNGSILADGAEAGAVLYQLVHAADASDLAHTMQSLYQDVLDTIAVADRLDQYDQSLAVDAVLFSIARQATKPAFWGHAPEMNGLIASLSLLARDGNADLIPSYEWVVNNAIWALGRIAIVPAYHQTAVAALVAAQDALPYLSVPFLWTVNVLDLYADCETSTPMVTLCMADVKPALEAQLFPNTFTFDDGALVVRTPLSLEELQPLYHAAKEVGAQFNRITETIVPISGDPSGVLTMIIYGTRSDYQDYQTLLYNLPTNNGGIYIEQQATFYTYERLWFESTYTLEELLRHEYVHYLVGRFLIDGFWGEVPIYDGGRMIWFDEGLAEFLVWSTPGDRVRPRKNLVDLVADDGPNRLTVADVLHADYDGFTFYRYAGLFFYYLYEHDIGTLRQLLGYAHASDTAGFDALVDSLSQDAGLEASYQAFLDALVAQAHLLDDPSTSFPDLTTLDTADIATIEAAFRDTRLGRYAKCSLAAIGVNPRFSCRGTLTTVRVHMYPDLDATWEWFDDDLDEIIGELIDDAALDNFQHVTCRFARMSPYMLDGGDYYTLADYYCEGPLGAGPHSLLPHLVQVEQDFEDTRIGARRTVCTEPSPGEIRCTLATSTRLFPAGTAQAVLQAKFDDGVRELHNQVYATRPSYYRDLDCASAGNERVVNYPGNQIYMVGTIRCTARFTP